MQQHQAQPHQFSNNISGKKQCPKITQYIADKPARLKSYFRRRHVPFKRTYDMNLQCGTTSLLIQISDDIEECLPHHNIYRLLRLKGPTEQLYKEYEQTNK